MSARRRRQFLLRTRTLRLSRVGRSRGLLIRGEFDIGAGGRLRLLARRRCGRDGGCDGTSESDFGVVGRGGVSGQVRGDLDLLRFELRDLGDVVGALGGEFGAGLG